MIPESELFEIVHRWPPPKRLLYEIGLAASLVLVGILGAVIVGGLTMLFARLVVDSDLSALLTS